mmetsp:Transcript_74659/g.210918  ORF Transcript_74659/g.210918 Transcript_74659/m.210918 type:complete len:241 (-) Transcript_74659:310-1032(-)
MRRARLPQGARLAALQACWHCEASVAWTQNTRSVQLALLQKIAPWNITRDCERPKLKPDPAFSDTCDGPRRSPAIALTPRLRATLGREVRLRRGPLRGVRRPPARGGAEGAGGEGAQGRAQHREDHQGTEENPRAGAVQARRRELQAAAGALLLRRVLLRHRRLPGVDERGRAEQGLDLAPGEPQPGLEGRAEGRRRGAGGLHRLDLELDLHQVPRAKAGDLEVEDHHPELVLVAAAGAR